MNEPTGLAGATGTWAIGCVMVCVAAAAMLLASRPSESANVTAAETQQASAATSQTRTGQAKTAAGQTTAQASMSASLFAPAAATANASDIELAPAAGAQGQETVTVTGCLEERKDQTFRLTNTAGDAPKSRSWKSGFIKKAPTSIDLVDAANKMKLHSHVGEQITVSGMLADRELRVRSLKRLAKSCD